MSSFKYNYAYSNMAAINKMVPELLIFFIVFLISSSMFLSLSSRHVLKCKLPIISSGVIPFITNYTTKY